MEWDPLYPLGINVVGATGVTISVKAMHASIRAGAAPVP
jgi:hypothetical protein